VSRNVHSGLHPPTNPPARQFVNVGTSTWWGGGVYMSLTQLQTETNRCRIFVLCCINVLNYCHKADFCSAFPVLSKYACTVSPCFRLLHDMQFVMLHVPGPVPYVNVRVKTSREIFLC
jgi:hypothetical protein